MAEDFPEDKYDFKPNPASAALPSSCCMRRTRTLLHQPYPWSGRSPLGNPQARPPYKSKAEVAAFVKKSFADGAALIKEKGDAGMSKLFLDPFSP